jgi:hypothetical protein
MSEIVDTMRKRDEQLNDRKACMSLLVRCQRGKIETSTHFQVY